MSVHQSSPVTALSKALVSQTGLALVCTSVRNLGMAAMYSSEVIINLT